MTRQVQKYVIDANVLFSAFISGKEVYTLLFSEHTISVPDFTFLELEKYKQRILNKTKLTEDAFQGNRSVPPFHKGGLGAGLFNFPNRFLDNETVVQI